MNDIPTNVSISLIVLVQAFGGALGALSRAGFSDTQPTRSRRTMYDALIGMAVGILSPVLTGGELLPVLRYLHPLAAWAAQAFLIALFSNYVTTALAWKAKLYTAAHAHTMKGLDGQFPHFLSEVWRMRWPLVLSIGVVSLRSTSWLPWDSHVTVALHKPALACIGVIVAHIVVQQAFPYLSGQDLLDRALGRVDRSPDMAAAVSFLGLCVLRAGLYGGIILGVTLGL